MLREKLESIANQYQPGQRIPSERDLAARLGVARMTLRTVIEAMILEGKLERRPGSGTYVTDRCFSLSAKCRSFSAEMRSRGLVPRNKLFSQKISTADKVISSRLRIPSGSRVLKFARVRYGDETPMAFQVTYVPMSYLSDIEGINLEDSLEEVLQSHYGISISTSQTEISLDYPDGKILQALNLEVGTPCLVKETIDIDQRLRTVMWNKTWYNAELFRIKFASSCDISESNLDSVSKSAI